MKKILYSGLLLLTVIPVLVSAQNIRGPIISKAVSLIGTPYKYGGTTPSGFDCSGFITYLYKGDVPGLPRISRNMALFGTLVNKINTQPGDLMFFATGRSSTAITHVAVYIGDNTIIHAVSAGPETGVIVTGLDTTYWKKHYTGAVRVLEEIRIAENAESASGTNTAQKPNIQPQIEEALSAKPPEKSPWNDWDGIIEGDFNLWLEKDKNAFEEWKKNN